MGEMREAEPLYRRMSENAWTRPCWHGNQPEQPQKVDDSDADSFARTAFQRRSRIVQINPISKPLY
jgi:hypothetical protein